MKSEPGIELAEKQDFQLSGNFHFFQAWFWTKLDVLFVQLGTMVKIFWLYLCRDRGPQKSQHLLPQGRAAPYISSETTEAQLLAFLLALDKYFLELMHLINSRLIFMQRGSIYSGVLQRLHSHLHPPNHQRNLHHICSEHTEIINVHNKIEGLI